jgi:hypothetical protein
MGKNLQPKQVDKFLAAFIAVTAFVAGGANTVVTAAVTTALSTAASGGGSVPLQVSSTELTEGVISSGTFNRVEIYANGSKLKLTDANGDEVYGRLTEASGVYTLTYFAVVAGVETAYTMPASTSIDFEFAYRYSFLNYPSTGAIGIQARRVSEDSGSGAGKPFAEKPTVTALNVLAALTKTPISVSILEVVVNGKSHDSFSGDFTLAGKTITWVPGTAGYSLETTDSVVCRYFTFE